MSAICSADDGPWYATHYDGPINSPVTSVRVEVGSGPHARITVWNRHANAGTLTVNKEDAETIALRLVADVRHYPGLEAPDK